MVRKKLVNSFFFYGTIYLGDNMKKRLFVILLLIIVLIISGCGKKKEEVKKEVVNDIRELKEEEIDNLMSRIEALYYFDINPAKSFKTSELTNQEVLLWASYNIDMVGMEFGELESSAKEYLNFSLEPENILCMTHFNILDSSDYIYLYDVSSKTFVKNDNHSNHKKTGYYSFVINKYKESKYENGNYIVKVYKLFSDTSYTGSLNNMMKFNWFRSYSDAKSNKDSLISGDAYTVKEKFDSIDSSKLIEYTYTFKLKDNRYVLYSYEIGE